MAVVNMYKGKKVCTVDNDPYYKQVSKMEDLGWSLKKKAKKAAAPKVAAPEPEVEKDIPVVETEKTEKLKLKVKKAKK